MPYKDPEKRKQVAKHSMRRHRGDVNPTLTPVNPKDVNPVNPNVTPSVDLIEPTDTRFDQIVKIVLAYIEPKILDMIDARLSPLEERIRKLEDLLAEGHSAGSFHGGGSRKKANTDELPFSKARQVGGKVGEA